MLIPVTIVPNILHTVTFHHDIAKSSLTKGTIAYIEGDDRHGAPNTDVQIVGLIYVCICGCQGIGSLPFYKYDNHDAWQWNGDREKPTLKPSIIRKKTCGWHGYLTDGIFQ
jgi:hypothetical protein